MESASIRASSSTEGATAVAPKTIAETRVQVQRSKPCWKPNKSERIIKIISFNFQV